MRETVVVSEEIFFPFLRAIVRCEFLGISSSLFRSNRGLLRLSPYRRRYTVVAVYPCLITTKNKLK